MSEKILVPVLGESISEATVAKQLLKLRISVMSYCLKRESIPTSTFTQEYYIQKYLTSPKNTLPLYLPWLDQLDGWRIGTSK